MSNSTKKRQTWAVRGFLLVGGVVVAGTVLTQAIRGTLFGANFVGLTSQNTNPSFVVDNTSFSTPIGTDDDQVNTGTGGLATDLVVWEPSPFRSGAEADRGLRTTSGSLLWLSVELLANPWGLSFDVVRGREDTGSGDLVYVDNMTQTGTIVIIPAGSGSLGNVDDTLIGPDEGIKAVTLGGVASGVEMRVKGAMIDLEP